MGLYMKALHAKVLAIKESNTGVTAYSFHPGLVATGTAYQAFVDSYGGVAVIKELCALKSDSAKAFDAATMSPGAAEACEHNPAWQNISNLADQCKETPW